MSVCVGGCGKVFELSVKLIKDCVKVSSSRGLTIHQHQVCKGVYVCGTPDIFKQFFCFLLNIGGNVLVGFCIHTQYTLVNCCVYVCVSKILLKELILFFSMDSVCIYVYLTEIRAPFSIILSFNHFLRTVYGLSISVTISSCVKTTSVTLMVLS